MAVRSRTDDEWSPTCGWSPAEVEWYLMGPFDGGVPGLVRRVRRILDVSQRGLAVLIGVSQSVVARWETGRTSPRMSAMERLYALAGLGSTVHDLGCVFTGDTLFEGGPGATGRSYSDGDLIKESIRSRLLDLPDDTVVHTGHGPDTTIGAERDSLAP